MRAHGNAAQWAGGYPSRGVLLDDIGRGWSHVIVHDGRVVGTFCLMTDEEPTYKTIEGAWTSTRPYVTIHRIASDGTCGRIFRQAVDFARRLGRDIRVDTHRDNGPMQVAAVREGFVYCGIITLADGGKRLAYLLAATGG